MTEKKDITPLLQAWRRGERPAAEKLMDLVYTELHRIADGYLDREQGAYSLQATALVNEAYVRLAGHADLDWKDRVHFFGISARIMRQILIQRARRRTADKRGGGTRDLAFDELLGAPFERPILLLDLEDALKELEKEDPRKGRVVELRFFGGLSNEEIAEILAVSTMTVKRDWRMARAWLYQNLNHLADTKT